MTIKFTLLVVFYFGLTFQTFSQDLPKTQKPIKQRYNLFHPTPKDSLRSFDPDRPNITESPYTVDAGHIQYEADFLRYEFKTTEESKEHALLYNYFNVKLGLTNSIALQLLVQTYAHQNTEQLNTHEKTSDAGFGDLTLRLKKNFLGNDGNVSLAVIPYLTFPTNHYTDNSRYEGGIIVPIMFKLKNDWQLSVQVEGDRLKDDAGNGMHNQLLQSVNITHPIFSKSLSASLETYYEYNLKDHSINSYVDPALQYQVSKALMFDVGFNLGIQKAADHALFAGIAFRL
ncbi:transporter [Mucilaginibacter arboris]|uniref:Transporter n=1 Tax=Mucilaginibacter arboris TaxID=2682090 RepID=A0A7K1STP3_9SPHI|nr:transporter [Mucilaginibacter arboris]MVN20689.1 transporter [Mucilaginibacter arboris]